MIRKSNRVLEGKPGASKLLSGDPVSARCIQSPLSHNYFNPGSVVADPGYPRGGRPQLQLLFGHENERNWTKGARSTDAPWIRQWAPKGE